MIMELNDFARQILFGNRLDDKIVRVAELEDLAPLKDAPIDIPRFPGRPPKLHKTTKLSRGEKAAFPSIHRLHIPAERGIVLHFFANHELLAMELMALMLLRFPDAPTSFRSGIGRIIQEEQDHLRLYLLRMKELGVEMGDIPVSDYFWNCLKNMQSPLDFTVQMSLTFEQANLDYSLFFMKAVENAGDRTTAEILERVFREEIGHVKHGVIWFNRWRLSKESIIGNRDNRDDGPRNDGPEKPATKSSSFQPNPFAAFQTKPVAANAIESDWEAYLRLLPPPLNPQRAKGFEFCESARRRAGFSEGYIQALKVHAGSKGRPPTLWLYNPYCESEIARGRPGFSAKLGSQLVSQDLEHLPMFLARRQDQVLVRRRPSAEWLESLQTVGFQPPEFLEVDPSQPAAVVTTPKIGGIEPWGWSPQVRAAFSSLVERLVSTSGGNSEWCRSLLQSQPISNHLAHIFSKSWGAEILNQWLIEHPESERFFGGREIVGITLRDETAVYAEIDRLLSIGHSIMIKAPYGTSGMQVKEIRQPADLSERIRIWIKNILFKQRGIVVERYLDPLVDLSVQLEIGPEKIQIFSARQMITGNHHEYRGAYLGKKPPGLNSEYQRFFHEALSTWQEFLRYVGGRLREEGYQGPTGVDALLWRENNGSIRIKPLIEVNPRWTMGRVALELEKLLAPGVNAVWLILPVPEIKKMGFASAAAFANQIREKYPIKIKLGEPRPSIVSGVLFTSDPSTVQSVVTLLATLPNEDLIKTLPCAHPDPMVFRQEHSS